MKNRFKFGPVLLSAWMFFLPSARAVNVSTCTVDLVIPESIQTNLDDDNDNEEWDKDDTPIDVADDDLEACSVYISVEPDFTGTVTVTFEEGGSRVANRAWIENTKENIHPLTWDVYEGQLVDPPPTTFYLEGVEHSDDWDDVKLKAVLYGSSAAKGQCSAEDEALTTVVEVDLDIDSKNDNKLEAAGYSSEEDKIEFSSLEDPELSLPRPGKFLVTSTYGDGDKDGIFDFADGLGFDPRYDGAGGDTGSVGPVHLVPIQITLKLPYMPEDSEILFNYTDSIPRLTTEGGNVVEKGTGEFDELVDSEEPRYYEINKCGLRIWCVDAADRSVGAAKDVPESEGKFVPVNKRIQWSDVAEAAGYSASARAIVLYVDYVDFSPDPQLSSLKTPLDVEVFSNDVKTNDKVFMTPIAVDVDLDSDNTTTEGYPDISLGDRGAEEDSAEDIDGYENYKGVNSFVNNVDLDSDEVPGFADGIDVFENLGSGTTVAFEALVVDLGKSSLLLPDMEILFNYDESSPISVEKDEFDLYEVPETGCFRIWTKDGSEARLTGDAKSGGDFVASDNPYTVEDLGGTDSSGALKLYLEAVNQYAEIDWKRIKISVYPKGVADGFKIDITAKIRQFVFSPENWIE
jgi:hypothetical protein